MNQEHHQNANCQENLIGSERCSPNPKCKSGQGTIALYVATAAAPESGRQAVVEDAAQLTGGKAGAVLPVLEVVGPSG